MSITTSLLSPGLNALTGLLGKGASNIASSAFYAIARDFGTTAGHAATWLWAEIGSATSVGFSGAPFLKLIGITLAIAVTVGLALFIIQIITSVLRRDPSGLARAGRGLLIAFLGGAAAIGVVNLLLAATDALSNGVVQAATGDTVASLGKAILGTVALGSNILGPVTIILISVMILAGIVFIWFAMTIRKLLIIVAAVFAPIAFAGALADVTTGWVKKWIEGMLALIFSKLILVIILVTGYFALIKGVGTPGVASGATHPTEMVTQLAVGGLILMLGAFAPWIALKTVHFAGDHMAQVHAHATSATAGVNQVVAAPQKMQSMAGSMPFNKGGGGGSPAGAAPEEGAEAAGAEAAEGATGAAASGSAAAGPIGVAAYAATRVAGSAKHAAEQNAQAGADHAASASTTTRPEPGTAAPGPPAGGAAPSTAESPAQAAPPRPEPAPPAQAAPSAQPRPEPAPPTQPTQPRPVPDAPFPPPAAPPATSPQPSPPPAKPI